MTTEIDLVLKAVDEASGVVSGAADRVNESLGGVNKANVQLEQAQRSTDSSAKDLAVGFSGMATAGFSLYMTIDRVEKSNYALEKAHLAVSRSNESLEAAQKTYNAALERYGADSTQAKDAADKLAIAHEANSLALERANLAQGNVNNAMMQGALTVIPSIITMVSSLSSVRGILESVTSAGAVAEGVAATATSAAAAPTTVLTAASWGLNASLLANPLVWIVIAIAAFVAALYLAYTYCEPFRNAIDGIGAALKDNLGKAVEVIGVALTWIWNNVLVPLGNFIGAVFTAYINTLITVFRWLYDNAIKPIGEALSWLWNNVLVPLGNFLYSVFIAELQALGAAFNWLLGVLQPVIDVIMGFFNAVNGALSAVGNAVGGFCSWVSGAVTGFATGTVETIASMTGKSQALTEAWTAQSVADVDAAMTSQLAAVQKAYDEQTTVIDVALQQQLTDIDAHYATLQDEAKTAFDAQYADFLAFYQSQLEPAQETELQKLVDKWAEHFDKQITDMNDAYDAQIATTTQFFDDMIAAANEKLNAIRESRKADLDNLELNMLLEKEALKASHDAGALSTEEYNKAVSDLEKTYNASRKETNDDYRLKELQMEKTVKDETVQINADKVARVEEITAEHNTAITEKEQEKSNKIAEIENKDKQLRADYANTVAALEQNKATETEQAIETAEKLKKAAHEKYETETKTIVTNAENEKQRIIKASQDKIATDTGTWSSGITNAFSGLSSSVSNAWGGMCSGISSAFNGFASAVTDKVSGFCNGVKDWFSGLSAAITGGSIWPDMLKSMEGQADTHLGKIQGRFREAVDDVKAQVESVDAAQSSIAASTAAFVAEQKAAVAEVAAAEPAGKYSPDLTAYSHMAESAGMKGVSTTPYTVSFEDQMAAFAAKFDVAKQTLADYTDTQHFAGEQAASDEANRERGAAEEEAAMEALIAARDKAAQATVDYTDTVDFAVQQAKDAEASRERIAAEEEAAMAKLVQSKASAAGVGGVSTAWMTSFAKPEKPSVSIQISAPLVQIQGSADQATAVMAVGLVQESLKNVLVEATSPSAPSTKKKITLVNSVQ